MEAELDPQTVVQQVVDMWIADKNPPQKEQDQVKNKFVEEGIKTVSDLKNISDDDWKGLGFKMGTRNWFKKKMAD